MLQSVGAKLLPLVFILEIPVALQQMTTADGCYKIYRNTKAVGLAPFERRYGMSEQQCLGLCTKNACDCKAVQYDCRSGMCDMFCMALSCNGKRKKRDFELESPAGNGRPFWEETFGEDDRYKRQAVTTTLAPVPPATAAFTTIATTFAVTANTFTVATAPTPSPGGFPTPSPGGIPGGTGSIGTGGTGGTCANKCKSGHMLVSIPVGRRKRDNSQRYKRQGNGQGNNGNGQGNNGNHGLGNNGNGQGNNGNNGNGQGNNGNNGLGNNGNGQGNNGNNGNNGLGNNGNGQGNNGNNGNGQGNNGNGQGNNGNGQGNNGNNGLGNGQGNNGNGQGNGYRPNQGQMVRIPLTGQGYGQGYGRGYGRGYGQGQGYRPQQQGFTYQVANGGGCGRLVNCPGFNYYVPTGACGAATAAPVGPQCPGNYFRDPQHILVGFAQTVTQAGSIDECAQLCANSQARFGFKCVSGMFYSSDKSQNCILNTETRTTQPDKYIVENEDKVDYFELNCTARFVREAVFFNRMRNRNVIRLLKSDFGNWTMCDRGKREHSRYKNCRTGNPNKCEVVVRSCDPSKEMDYDFPESHTSPSTKTTTTSTTTTKTSTTTTTSTTRTTPTSTSSPSTKRSTTSSPPKLSTARRSLTPAPRNDQNHVGNDHVGNHAGNDVGDELGDVKTENPLSQTCQPILNPDGSKDCSNGVKLGLKGKKKKCKPKNDCN